MTRFEMEISGKFGAYWIESAKKDVENAMKKAAEDAIVEEDGAIRWKSNGNYLPKDFCEMLVYGGFDFDNDATEAKREEQTSRYIEEYKRRRHQPTEEEMHEMRACFGAGAIVVDAITGQKIYL